MIVVKDYLNSIYTLSATISEYDGIRTHKHFMSVYLSYKLSIALSQKFDLHADVPVHSGRQEQQGEPEGIIIYLRTV